VSRSAEANFVGKGWTDMQSLYTKSGNKLTTDEKFIRDCPLQLIIFV
jgi:hypothetical protein